MSVTVPAPSICAVVVTYKPDPDEIPVVLARLAPQVEYLLVVDNSPGSDELARMFGAALPGNATWVRNATNEGLAAAYNRAADWARARDCRFVLLMDQDSLVEDGMVRALADAYARLSLSAAVAAVGPCFIDANTGAQAPFVRIGFPLNRKLQCPPAGEVECDFLISSGSLIPLDVLDAIGGMDESLFIDNVDLEWCLRARARGLRLFGVGSARMRHRLGDHVRRLPLGLGAVVVHSGTRLRYMMRNRVLLYRRSGTPRVWIAQDIPRLVLKFLRLSLFVAPRARNARAMLRGMLDGMLGRTGRIEER